MIYDVGGKFDRSFNQSAAEGVEQFKLATGVRVRELEITDDAQREHALNHMARRGSTVIAVIGFNNAAAAPRSTRSGGLCRRRGASHRHEGSDAVLRVGIGGE